MSATNIFDEFSKWYKDFQEIERGETWRFYKFDDYILRIATEFYKGGTKCKLVQKSNKHLSNEKLLGKSKVSFIRYMKNNKIFYIKGMEGDVWVSVAKYNPRKPPKINKWLKGKVIAKGAYGFIVDGEDGEDGEDGDQYVTKYEILNLEKARDDMFIYAELLRIKPDDCLPCISDEIEVINEKPREYPTYVLRKTKMPKAESFERYLENPSDAVDSKTLINRIWSIAEKFILLDMKPGNTVLYNEDFKFIDFDSSFVQISNKQFFNFTYMSYLFLMVMYREYKEYNEDFIEHIWEDVAHQLSNYTVEELRNDINEIQNEEGGFLKPDSEELDRLMKHYGSNRIYSEQSISRTLENFVQDLKQISGGKDGDIERIFNRLEIFANTLHDIQLRF